MQLEALECGAASLTTVIASLAAIIEPAFSRVFMDRLLTGQNREWFYPFIIGLAAVQIIVSWIRAAHIIKIQGKFAVVADSRYMWHVLRLPMGMLLFYLIIMLRYSVLLTCVGIFSVILNVLQSVCI